ncbi:uncharacterized protein LOC134213651 isoform X2 [Armigeres subalbatus]|uniref:uncharacterized protein LOC134213651 isoform X2 n=1 Tax=Armigeres subalbatus TaxID=124917 RepID=UPI002ED0BECF
MLKMQMLELLLICCLSAMSVLGEPCPDQTRPHASRCDQYFRCVLLPSKTHVWVPTQCKKGLIYEPQLKTCVLPGDNWECDLSAEDGDESGENVYGINNLPAAIYTGPTRRPITKTTPLVSADREVVALDNGYGVGVSGGGITTEQDFATESETDTPGGLQVPNLPSINGDNEGQATIYDNLREQIMNDSMYSNYKTAFVDVYGNHFPLQSPIPNAPIYSYPQQQQPSPPPSPPQMAYPVYNPPQYQYQNPYLNPYYEQSQALNRLRNTLENELQSNENVLSEEVDDASPEVQELDEPEAVNLNLSNEQEDEETSDLTGTKKLIAVGGSIMNYKDYKDSILPLLNVDPTEVRISVLTCTLGSRQPNKTDCTKYYVCNPQNGAFQSFTCPSFTAFNADTRLCDSDTYRSCQNNQQATTTQLPTTISRVAPTTLNSKISSETNQLKQDLLTAHKYLDMIKKQAYQILSRTKVTTEKPTEEYPEDDGMIRIIPPTMSTGVLPSITAPTFISTTMKRLRAKPKRKHTKKRTSVKSGLHKSAFTKTSHKSAVTERVATTTTAKPPPPKAPKCKQNGKMADPAVKHNYYVCYKATPRKFIKTRMACPSNLVYCEATQLCTFDKKCK